VSIGRFYGGIAALIRSPADGKYLLLKRSPAKDFGAGAWECVTGRVDQGEGFEDALHREVREELGVEVDVEYLIGTTHFHRGEARPENELIGVIYCCSLASPESIRISAEHATYRWVTAGQAVDMLTAPDASTHWIIRVIERAEAIRRRLPPALIDYYRQVGFELG
jgi:8-oxo-dGTP pyrophosphatase MutT (NUDIX family)